MGATRPRSATTARVRSSEVQAAAGSRRSCRLEDGVEPVERAGEVQLSSAHLAVPACAVSVEEGDELPFARECGVGERGGGGDVVALAVADERRAGDLL